MGHFREKREVRIASLVDIPNKGYASLLYPLYTTEFAYGSRGFDPGQEVSKVRVKFASPKELQLIGMQMSHKLGTS